MWYVFPNYLSMTSKIKLLEKVLENWKFAQNLLNQNEIQSISFKVDMTGGCLSLLLPVFTIKATPQRERMFHIRETQEGCAHEQMEDTIN